MLFHFGDTLVEIDSEATRNYYLYHDCLNDCVRLGCQNFRQWTKYCPENIQEQFHQFGIDDLNQIIEILPCDVKLEDTQQPNGILYLGAYHVIGRIIESGESSKWKLSESFTISVSEELALAMPDFPEPAMKIIISAYLPWVIASPMDDYIL